MKKLTNAFALLAISLLPGSLQAGSIDLTQGGWSFGGPLALSFAGDDVNTDGLIDLSELSDFRAEFLFSDGTTTAWLLPDLQDGFFFSGKDDFLIFAANPDYSLVDIAFEGEALGSIFDQFLFPVDETQALASEVPEPSTAPLLGVIATVLLANRARRHRREKPSRKMKQILRS